MRLMKFALAAFAAGAFATPMAMAQDADLGKVTFGQYCATCHGAGGKGDGPLTELMLEGPSDLTQLAKNNDGKFPMLDVIHIVDGRTGLRGHGGPMPVYGALFEAEAAEDFGPFGSIAVTRGRILSVVYYLESLQEE